jgi:DNA-binding IclR family transcriptional regulator
VTLGADDEPPPDGPPVYTVRAADSVLQILLMFDEHRSVRVTDVAQRLDVARSTAHRLLATLVHRGFATHDPRTRRYLPGAQLWRIGMSAVGTLDLHERARPHLRRLRDATGETVHLLMLEGRQVRFSLGFEGVHGLRGGVRDGLRLPAHATSGGKYLLAHLEPEAIAELYRDAPEQLTAWTIHEHDAMAAEFARIRRDGYATSDREGATDLAAVAAGVWGPAGPIAAIAVAAPATRLGPDVIPVIVGHARAACLALSEELGGCPPVADRPARSAEQNDNVIPLP